MSTVRSSQDSTLPSKAEWCFECYRHLPDIPLKEAKFRILCHGCEKSLYLCEDHADAARCPKCPPTTRCSKIPASNISPTTVPSDDVAFGLLRDAQIEGLENWLKSLSLQKYLLSAIVWCHDNGASSLQEVIANWQQLADELCLKPLEKKRMSEDPRCRPAVFIPLAGPPDLQTMQTAHAHPAALRTVYGGPMLVGPPASLPLLTGFGLIDCHWKLPLA